MGAGEGVEQWRNENIVWLIKFQQNVRAPHQECTKICIKEEKKNQNLDL
jgi:hypothetical protein